MKAVQDIASELLSGESVFAFHWSTKAWYADAAKKASSKHDITDEMSMGIYHCEGGTSGEFTMDWQLLQGKSAARVKMFDDCWALFPVMPDFFALLAEVGTQSDVDAITPLALTQRLITMGWRDLTSYRQNQPDGFERRYPHGAIPRHLRVFGDEWTHFAATRHCCDDWLDQLSGPHHVYGSDLLLLTNDEDATLSHLRCG